MFAFVTVRGKRPEGDEAVALAKELRDHVAKQIGAIAKPDDIRFADNLPKTRSGKIMRRLLRSIAKGEEITSDTSTLENRASSRSCKARAKSRAAGLAARRAAVLLGQQAQQPQRDQ